MAAMSTTLTEFSDRENARTYLYPGHTVALPRLVIQKRKVPVATTDLASNMLSVVFGCEDAAGSVLERKGAIEVTNRYPANCAAADLAAALVVFRDIVNSDEFATMITSQAYVA
jgi:hypothetical protein